MDEYVRYRMPRVMDIDTADVSCVCNVYMCVCVRVRFLTTTK